MPEEPPNLSRDWKDPPQQPAPVLDYRNRSDPQPRADAAGEAVRRLQMSEGCVWALTRVGLLICGFFCAIIATVLAIAGATQFSDSIAIVIAAPCIVLVILMALTFRLRSWLWFCAGVLLAAGLIGLIIGQCASQPLF